MYRPPVRCSPLVRNLRMLSSVAVTAAACRVPGPYPNSAPSTFSDGMSTTMRDSISQCSSRWPSAPASSSVASTSTMFNLDLDADEHVLGLEILGARRHLPPALMAAILEADPSEPSDSK